jgi:RNase P/RNase MRP subunit p30
MQIINTTNLNETRKEIQKLKKQKQPIIVLAQSPEFNRKILENPDVDILLGCEIHNRKDSLKQRDSGLNEVLCKLATKNNIKIAINLPALIRLPKIQKAKALARIMQNIMLCKKTKTHIIVFPEKYKKLDVISLFLSLKSSTQQAKKAF